ncbi:MAG: VWA domain-containing protein [Vicinamibacterales bacterium]
MTRASSTPAAPGLLAARPVLAALAVVAALAATTLVTVEARPQQVFRGASDTVRVFVTVTDRDGRLVTTLTQNQFEIRDEGKPQPIVVFDNSPQPIQLIVMLDVSGSMRGNLPLLRASAEQLFARLGPDDVARVGTFGREIQISPTFTRDAAELRAALPPDIAEDAPTPLWRALEDGMAAFDPASDRRRVLLVLSDGKDTGPTKFGERFVSQIEVIDKAREDDVMVYGIGLRSRTGAPPQVGMGAGGLQAMLTADLPDPGLARAALETGGGYAEIRPRDDLGAAFAQVADELHSQYLIGFTPPKRDGKKHDVDVRVSDRGLKPRARKSYVAPKGQ